MGYVVAGCSTYSKAAYLDLPDYPIEFSSAHDCEVIARTADGHQHHYIDFTASLGAIILGYRLYDHVSFNNLLPGPHLSEETAAQELCKATGWKQVRWCKNGSDATEAAVRLARFVTKRPRIITNSYHGSHSDLIGATPGKDGGVLADCYTFLDSCDSPETMLQAIDDSVACVLMEPVTPKCANWHLEELAAACKQTGTLLIFDEILTGFRSCFGSITPIKSDLACYGKAIGNGASIACVAGPEALMQHFVHDVFMSGTYATEIPSLLQCWMTLKDLREENYAHFYNIEDQLLDVLGPIVKGYAGRWQIQLPQEQHRQFVSALAKRKVLVGRDFFLMFAHLKMHDNQWNQVFDAIREARKEANV